MEEFLEAILTNAFAYRPGMLPVIASLTAVSMRGRLMKRLDFLVLDSVTSRIPFQGTFCFAIPLDGCGAGVVFPLPHVEVT